MKRILLSILITTCIPTISIAFEYPYLKATGAVRIDDYKVTKSGDVLLCNAIFTGEQCIGDRGYKPIRKVIPSGKIYLGFRLVSGIHGSLAYDVYWKDK